MTASKTSYHQVGSLAGLCAALFVAVLAAASVSIALPRDGFLAPVWIANAFALAALLTSPTRNWPFLVASAVAGNVAAEIMGHVPVPQAVGFTTSNIIEYVLPALALRRRFQGSPDFTKARDLVALAVAVVLSATLAAVLSSSLLLALTGAEFLASFRTWALAHSLGLLTIAPCLVIVCQPGRYLGHIRLNARVVGSALLLVAITLVVFAQNRFPILFLIPPALLLVSMELETFGAAAGVLIVEVIALGSLFTRTGPMMLVHGDGLERAAVMQVFLIAALLSSLPVAALNVRRRQVLSALAENEARYRRLADNASDIVTEADLSGRFTYVSPAVKSITGFDEEEVLGRKAIDLVHPDDRERVRKEIAEVLTSAFGRQVEHRHIRKDGRVIWVESRPTFVKDQTTGEAFAVTDMLRDVTERKTLELELEAARVLAEAATAAKGEFLANMSHELRTPLTSILGFSDLLRGQEELSDQSRRSVERISGSGQALLSIVNDILDFSKLEAGQVEIKASSTPLGEMLRNALANMEPQADAKGLQLTFMEAGLPELALIDATRVRQLLFNIVGNAIKFTSSGGVTLSASYAADLERVRCEVIDTGEGISQAGLARLFQRFSQVDASSTRQHGGTGLGLAICKGLVEAMGGEIGAVSVPGQGSTFWFELPAPIVTESAVQLAEGSSLQFDLQGVRVLVADDNAINREIVRLMLVPNGAEVSDAESGEEAIKLAHEMPFDLILMDMRMPGIDGPAAARAIRSGAGPNEAVPILVFTADVLESFDGEKSVFDGCVHKPILPSQLLATVMQWTCQPVQQQAVQHG